MQTRYFLLFIILFSLQSCSYCGLDYYYELEPIYLNYDKLKDNISFTDSKKLNQLGKIYLYKNYIFVNEKKAGVHIIDNTNQNNPKVEGFIKIPFNTDIAIKNNVLYADTLEELISIDINDIKSPKVLKKIKLSENRNLFLEHNKLQSENKIQIGYKRKGPFYKPFICDSLPQTFSRPRNTLASIDSVSAFSTGKAGSLARFAIVNDYLYTVSPSSLNLYNIKDDNNFIDFGSVNIERNRSDIETIFPYKDKLFMGSQTGAYIYDNQNPQQPTFITKVEHTRSCDPVVVENDKAYVTLSSNNQSCRNGFNQLDIIDLSDIQNSKIIKSYPMISPTGLAINSGNLFVCDGKDGLKILDVKDPLNIIPRAKINIKDPMDIILNANNHGIVVAKDGLHQYDFSGLPDKKDFKELSFIKAENSKDEFVKEGNDYYYKWYKDYFVN